MPEAKNAAGTWVRKDISDKLDLNKNYTEGIEIVCEILNTFPCKVQQIYFTDISWLEYICFSLTLLLKIHLYV